MKKIRVIRTISFIPITDDVELSLAGFNNNCLQMLNIGSTLTISNEIESLQAKVTVHDGFILQIRSTDLN